MRKGDKRWRNLQEDIAEALIPDSHWEQFDDYDEYLCTSECYDDYECYCDDQVDEENFDHDEYGSFDHVDISEFAAFDAPAVHPSAEKKVNDEIAEFHVVDAIPSVEDGKQYAAWVAKNFVVESESSFDSVSEVSVIEPTAELQLENEPQSCGPADDFILV